MYTIILISTLYDYEILVFVFDTKWIELNWNMMTSCVVWLRDCSVRYMMPSWMVLLWDCSVRIMKPSCMVLLWDLSDTVYYVLDMKWNGFMSAMYGTWCITWLFMTKCQKKDVHGIIDVINHPLFCRISEQLHV